MTRQITSPIESPLEGAPRTVSYLWLFPGLAGTPTNPLPGPWPTPRQVVQACCEVMDVHGREMLHLGHDRLLSEDIFAQVTGDHLVQTTRMLAIHILMVNCRWYASAKGPPMRYTTPNLAEVFRRARNTVWKVNKEAQDFLDTDIRFRSLYDSVLKRLEIDFTIERNRPMIEPLRKIA